LHPTKCSNFRRKGPPQCELCGKTLPKGVTPRRRYCSWRENPTCYNKRERANRVERERK